MGSSRSVGTGGNMSDDEYERMSNTSSTSMKGDEAFAKRKAGMDKNSLNESLKDYINQWRDERQKEEEELKRLKDKQAKRKEVRAEQEKAMAQKKREEEEKVKREEAEKKALEAEAKKKAMEEAEIKRQEMLAAQKELSKSKEQVEEECRISLNIRLKPLQLDAMDSDELKSKARMPIRGTFVSEGTLPEGSTWAMNPIPPRCLGGGCREGSGCTPCPGTPGSDCTSCDDTPDPSFEPPCNEGRQSGICSGNQPSKWGPVSVVDTVLVPANIPTGKYVLGWRMDCEATAQVWSNCADITITN